MTDYNTESLDTENLGEKLEALLIVAEEPLGVVGLATSLGVPVPTIEQELRTLQDDYDGKTGSRRRGFELREIAGGYRFYVRDEHTDLVAEFIHQETPAKLSQAALETLAVIAYRQPVTRGAVAAVRAVNVDSVVRTLVNRGLITEVGSDEVTGAILYGTTDLLLENLGIQSIADLPPIAPFLDDGEEGFEDEHASF